ncbi:hypothetical protein B1759_11920 [Rubrivirga sp. SAORIC476]|uniref:SRPBCC domain-containing protein n=1 Tax=Rubrivirga sp. SAORIC476 TaxID=1961794 RepID=UPI000BA980A3|nr:SRPBCC domain-containing protein [Rubrivirga sp. SAORIC476]PAP79064.1 hypothetical protein B1759_11920 [Rubrivirga sp. SAORIC476]
MTRSQGRVSPDIRDSMPTSNRTDRLGPRDYRVYTEIDIAAPAPVVWATLTDFERLSDWSTSFRGLTGDFWDGGAVTATFRVLGVRQTYEHVLFDVEDGVQWAWSDPLGAGIRDHHVYRVEPTGETTARFVHTDRATGGYVGLLNRLVARVIRSMCERFNEELRAEAERRYAISRGAE